MKRRNFTQLIALVGLIVLGYQFFFQKDKKNIPKDVGIESNNVTAWMLRRNISPNDLPPAFQEWLDPVIPLPKSINLIPAKIYFWSLIYLFPQTLMFFSLGIGILYDSIFNNRARYDILDLFFTIVGLVMLVLAAISFKAMRDKFEMIKAKRDGAFRWGIFLCQSGLLVYLSNEKIHTIQKGNWRARQSYEVCHLIPRDIIEDTQLKSRLVARPGARTIARRHEIVISVRGLVIGLEDQITFSANALTIPDYVLVRILKQWSQTGVFEGME